MTENEAKRPKIAIVGGGRSVGRTLMAQMELLEEVEAYRAIGLTPQMVKDLIASEKKAHKTALENAELLDEYQAIGTVEECRNALERMKPKKIKTTRTSCQIAFGKCPSCGEEIDELKNPFYHTNSKCLQKLDWSE